MQHRIASRVLGPQLLRSVGCSAWSIDLPASVREYAGPSCPSLPSAPAPLPPSSSGAVPQRHAIIAPQHLGLLGQQSPHPPAHPLHMHMQTWMQTWIRHMSTTRTLTTPNPQSLMFYPGKTLIDTGSRTFSSPSAADCSPLASRIFALDGVASIFFGNDFITVTKRDDEVPWATLKPSILAAIDEFIASGEPVLNETAASETAAVEEDDEIVAVIKELLETRIRPAVQEDGGDIKFRSFDLETGVVTVAMMGSCSGCPSSTVTLKSGVENMLMHYVAEVTSVVQEEDDDSEGVKALAQLEAKLGDKDT